MTISRTCSSLDELTKLIQANIDIHPQSDEEKADERFTQKKFYEPFLKEGMTKISDGGVIISFYRSHEGSQREFKNYVKFNGVFRMEGEYDQQIHRLRNYTHDEHNKLFYKTPLRESMGNTSLENIAKSSIQWLCSNIVRENFIGNKALLGKAVYFADFSKGTLEWVDVTNVVNELIKQKPVLEDSKKPMTSVATSSKEKSEISSASLEIQKRALEIEFELLSKNYKELMEEIHKKKPKNMSFFLPVIKSKLQEIKDVENKLEALIKKNDPTYKSK